MPKSAGLSFVSRMNNFVVNFSVLKFKHSYQREVYFILILGLSLFFWTAVSSFHPLDSSPFSVSIPPVPPSNLAGSFGAFLSSSTIFFFGYAAFLLPFPLLLSALFVVKKDITAFANARTLGWVLFFCTMTAAIAILKPYTTLKGFDFPSGGIIGDQIAKVLLTTLGKVGLAIVLVTSGIVALLLVFREAFLSNLGTRVVKLGKNSDFSLGNIRDYFRTTDSDRGDVDSEEKPKRDIPPIFTNTNDADGDLEFTDHSIDTAFDDTGIHPALHLPPTKKSSPGSYRAPPADPGYKPPPIGLFQKSDAQNTTTANQKELESTANMLVKTFADFGVMGQIIGYQPGPVVTVYEFQPDAGVKQSKILGLMDDLALALKVDSIFIHPVRGKRALGVQVPNTKRDCVYLGDVLSASTFQDSASPLTFGMGKTINGVPISADLATMPHLLIAGATGSGKSVAVNAMLSSIIMKATPAEVRMILVDPKMLELSVYEGIPHLLMPVITEPTKASLALKWAAAEMERRYKIMQLACVRNIAGFNEFWAKASTQRKQEIQEALSDESITRLPYILLVIDELADLMMTAPKDVESSIQRLAQKARASGIHMVLATQRPSVDIITGVIKANLPCRIAFQVVSKHDSRTILDLIGAEKLLGKGDMLLQRPGIGRLERIQGALISDEEVINLVAAVKQNAKETYDESIISWIDEEYNRQKKDGEDGDSSEGNEDDDPKWDDAINIGRTHGVVSASFLQRHLKIGYNRAARMVEAMEARGYVDKADGSKPRKWLGN